MKISTLFSTTAVLASLTASAPLWAQAYPTKPVKMINASTPGGSVDVVARIVATGLSPVLGQQVVVENRPGGNSNIAAEAVAKAPPDGYTLFAATTTNTLNASLFKGQLNYDLLKDLAPVTEVASAAHVMVVNPKLPAKNVTEFIKLAKSRPGDINYSSAGVGTSAFLAAELFSGRAGIDLTHVPYKGGADALQAVVSGEVQLMFPAYGGSGALIQAGKMRALAVTSVKRNPLLPDTPTVSESGLPGFQAGTFWGVLVPAKTPRPIIDTLNKATVTSINKADTAKRLTDLGYEVIGNTPEQFAVFLRNEVEALAKVVKEKDLKAD